VSIRRLADHPRRPGRTDGQPGKVLAVSPSEIVAGIQGAAACWAAISVNFFEVSNIDRYVRAAHEKLTYWRRRLRPAIADSKALHASAHHRDASHAFNLRLIIERCRYWRHTMRQVSQADEAFLH
jgi:hypothetical protein